jgi:hypothetical protein
LVRALIMAVLGNEPEALSAGKPSDCFALRFNAEP